MIGPRGVTGVAEKGGEGPERERKNDAKAKRDWRMRGRRERLKAMRHGLVADGVAPVGRLNGL